MSGVIIKIFDSKPAKSSKITDLAPGLMSKKRDKNTKDGKDKKRCKSKNADGNKWELPRILQKIWGKKKGQRLRNQVTIKGPRYLAVMVE